VNGQPAVFRDRESACHGTGALADVIAGGSALLLGPDNASAQNSPEMAPVVQVAAAPPLGGELLVQSSASATRSDFDVPNNSVATAEALAVHGLPATTGEELGYAPVIGRDQALSRLT
jgi:hypothetical protein